MSQVVFNYNDVNFTFIRRNKLKTMIVNLFKREARLLDHINFIFCSDEFLLGINKSALNHDYYTDIITFDLSESKQCIGEVYISIDRVKENACLHQVSFNNELHRVIFHGCLHLCGFKDKSKKDAIIMRSMEDKYLNAYFK